MCHRIFHHRIQVMEYRCLPPESSGGPKSESTREPPESGESIQKRVESILETSKTCAAGLFGAGARPCMETWVRILSDSESILSVFSARFAAQRWSESTLRVLADRLRVFRNRCKRARVFGTGSRVFWEPQKRVRRCFFSRERHLCACLLYTSPSPRDRQKSRMPSSA